MWPFSKKYSIEEAQLMQGFTDWHCHVLPGLDDGIKDIADSMKVLKTYEQLGVDTIWFTPHIMEDVPNKTSDIRACFEWVKNQYNGPLKLRLAAENMMDNLYDRRLAEGDLLPIGEHGNHLLVETSYFTPPSDFNDKLSRTFKAGYFALLAHPERYVYMDLERYDELHEMGVKMQLNLSSLFGFYGKEAKKKAEYILEADYYNAIGSDTHRYSQVLTSLEKGRLSRKVLNMLDNIPGID